LLSVKDSHSYWQNRPLQTQVYLGSHFVKRSRAHSEGGAASL
jgi:hypothetical protein